ncbi:hypothetical protein [Draconibacterium mangrovi]|uniref:hypothetical protein n=1 Tax=Draconibacterium mangrovi TaxID=2697469 RepID=UPI0013D2A396|nr:hypothetical protein [Draconibacterium mangrovi]
MNTIGELITNMTINPQEFNHLKIFLHREDTKIQSDFGGKFLFVSPNSFGLVKLNDLVVENNNIQLYLEDVFTGQSDTFTIDTNDKSFQFLLIEWNDIQELVSRDS